MHQIVCFQHDEDRDNILDDRAVYRITAKDKDIDSGQRDVGR